MSTRTFCGAVILLFFIITMVPAQPVPPSVAGSWSMTATVLPPSGDVQVGSCLYTGTASVTQAGSEFTGTASLTLVSGASPCPAEMSADISGAVQGTAISGQLSSSILGTAAFTGTIGSIANAKGVKIHAQVGSPGSTITGTTTVTGGPFASGYATWSAAMAAGEAIPTLNEWVLLLLALLLMGAGLFFLRPYMGVWPKPPLDR
jgi:hypothetical protein